jgi:hypothetical protein
MEGVYSVHLVYFVAIWYTYVVVILHILLPFGVFYGYLVYFPRFGMFYQEKSGNPAREWFL